MKLYIQIIDNKPVNHPIMGDNFIQAFPDIDVENLPSAFAKFEMIEKPIIGPYQVYEGMLYDWVGSVVKNIHQVYNMSEEEILVVQNQAKAEWKDTGFISWIFNEETCTFVPPIPYPDGDDTYIWNEEFGTWDIV
jgi:hypothetical protein